MSDNLVKQWDEYVESMGCVMGEAEHMAQQMRDCIEELESKLVKAVEALRGSRETILELVGSRWSETEGTDQDWVGDIDTIIAAVAAYQQGYNAAKEEQGESDERD